MGKSRWNKTWHDGSLGQIALTILGLFGSVLSKVRKLFLSLLMESEKPFGLIQQYIHSNNAVVLFHSSILHVKLYKIWFTWEVQATSPMMATSLRRSRFRAEGEALRPGPVLQLCWPLVPSVGQSRTRRWSSECPLPRCGSGRSDPDHLYSTVHPLSNERRQRHLETLQTATQRGLQHGWSPMETGFTSVHFIIRHKRETVFSCFPFLAGPFCLEDRKHHSLM